MILQANSAHAKEVETKKEKKPKEKKTRGICVFKTNSQMLSKDLKRLDLVVWL